MSSGLPTSSADASTSWESDAADIWITGSHVSTAVSTSTSQTQWQCAQCSRIFYKSKDLERHSRTSSCTKSYRCDQCGKVFSIRTALIRHQNQHFDNTVHMCPSCSRSFHRKDHFDDHVASCHRQALSQAGRLDIANPSDRERERPQRPGSNPLYLLADAIESNENDWSSGSVWDVPSRGDFDYLQCQDEDSIPWMRAEYVMQHDPTQSAGSWTQDSVDMPRGYMPLDARAHKTATDAPQLMGRQTRLPTSGLADEGTSYNQTLPLTHAESARLGPWSPAQMTLRPISATATSSLASGERATALSLPYSRARQDTQPHLQTTTSSCSFREHSMTRTAPLPSLPVSDHSDPASYRSPYAPVSAQSAFRRWRSLLGANPASPASLCSSCDKNFTRASDLKRHQRQVHGLGHIEVRCLHDACGYRSSRRDKVQEHCRKMHGDTKGEERFVTDEGNTTSG